MLTFFKRLTTPPVFEGDAEKTRAAELLNIVLNTLIIVAALALVAVVLGRTSPPAVILAVIVLFLTLSALKIPAQFGYIRQSSIVVVVLLTTILTLALTIGGSIRAPAIVFYILASVISGLLISRRAIFWSVGINALIFFAIAWAEATGHLPTPNLTTNIQQPIIFTAASLLTAVLINLALKRQQEALEQVRSGEEQLASINVALEQRVNERTNELLIANQQVEKRASQLQVIADVARSVATIQETNQLLSTITKLVSERFGFYHVGIFLLDANQQYANLRAANSEGGKTMLARSHRLKVGEQGIVGFVTSRGQARVALDVGEEAVFFNNPDLPDTHSEVALPLKFGQQIIGALDIQSKDINAFSQDEVNIFLVLADQVSVAIQNTRSLEQTQRALAEAEAASSQLTGQAWRGYTEKIKTRGYRYDGIKPEPLNKINKSTEEETDALLSAVQLRGQTIGRLKLKASDSNHKWTDDERAIIASTAERVALAMESARLLDEAQKRATRESFLSEIGTKLGASFQLDSILRDTVEELGQTLKGSTVSFQLINPSAPPVAEESDDGSTLRKKSSDHD